MGLDIEQAQLKDGKKPDRPRANNQYIGLDRFAHSQSLRRWPAPRFYGYMRHMRLAGIAMRRNRLSPVRRGANAMENNALWE
jgi:hypothetical protein